MMKKVIDKKLILDTLLLLKSNAFGDAMEVNRKFGQLKNNTYVVERAEMVNIFTGEIRYFYEIEGQAKILGYLPGTTEFIPNPHTTIWYFPN